MVDKLKHDNHHLIHLDATIGSYAETHTTAQLRGKLNCFVARRALTAPLPRQRSPSAACGFVIRATA